ncbi:MAG: methionyl-tRNA formyltransferase [Patescibacteria group bacterium]
MDYKFTYYGTSDFSAQILQGLVQSGLTPQLVISTLAKPAGRNLTVHSTPVSQLAASLGIEIWEVSNLKSVEQPAKIAARAHQFAILAAFGKIIPAAVLGCYPGGIINVHPSLLPLYRGPSPIQYAIKDGAAETGVSLIVLDNEIDHGPIIAQSACALMPVDDAVTLANKLAPLAVKLLLDNLPGYLNGLITPKPQNHLQATFSKMISRADGQADFNKTALAIGRQRRAFTPWPGLWTYWREKRLKLIDVAVFDYQDTPGKVSLINNQVVISCGQGSLAVKLLQLEGGKQLTAADFSRGHKDFIGSTL